MTTSKISIHSAVETIATDYYLQFFLFWTVFYVGISAFYLHAGGEQSLDAVLFLWIAGGLGASTATLAYIAEYHHGRVGFSFVLIGVGCLTAFVVL